MMVGTLTSIPLSTFLSSWKKHKIQEHTDKGPQYAQENMDGEAKEKKQSWKRSFMSLWKLHEKKNHSRTDPPARSHSSKASRRARVSASGPLYGSVNGPSSKAQTGPLSSFFFPNKRVGNEKPYVCLGKINYPSVVESYGPVYLVT